MNIQSAPPLEPVIDPSLARMTGLRHGFFTRPGGVSTGLYAGLNTGLGSDDARDNVLENRRRIADWLGVAADAVAGCHQIHSADVITVNTPIAIDDRPKADALVTAKPGLALSVLTADCAPVLFADAERKIIGAAHAGWKGARTGVLENTVDAMIALGADTSAITAIVGPTISQTNYEVGADFAERFIGVDPANARYFVASTRAGHMMFDLPAYCLARLTAYGVQASATGHCTYADETRFFSYRRTTHRGEPDYGRQMSAIVIG